MRKIVIFLSFILSNIMAFSQQLNSRGEKMVDRIEVEAYSFRMKGLVKDKVYSFKYDSHGNVIELSLKLGKDEYRLTKENGKIVNTHRYDGELTDYDDRYEYLLDENGHIIQKVSYDCVSGPLTTKNVWNYMYRYDDFTGSIMLDSVSNIYLYRDINRGVRDFIPFSDFDEGHMTVKVIRGKDGLYYIRHDTHQITYTIDNVMYNVDIMDDTNVDLNVLWGGTPYTISSDVPCHMEFIVPEWANAKSGYLYDETKGGKFIVNKDGKGNITTIEVVNKFNNRLTARYTIYYK